MRRFEFAGGATSLMVSLLAVALLASAGIARAQETGAIFYPVERFELRYQGDTQGMPDLDEFLDTEITLGSSPQGYVSPTASETKVGFTLRAVPTAPAPLFDAGAIVSVNEQIVAALNRSGLVGVLIAPDPADIDSTNGTDLRADDRTLTLLVAVARVAEVRTRTVKEVQTLASGTRISEEEAVNNPAHAWIREGSPVRANDPLRDKELDDYGYWLSRHPGRRVDSLISPARDPGFVYVDYQVTETKPWFAYVNYSNTGTKDTTTDRERFGFTHNQLTGHDDILRIEYVTGNFDSVNGVFSTYQAPIPFTGRKLRGEVDFLWNQFDASTTGQAFDAAFSGEQWEVGGRLAYQLYQHGPLFLDAFAGFRYQHVELDQLIESGDPVPGESDFFYPTVGFRLERFTPTSLLDARLSFDWSDPSLAGTEPDLANLGRVGAERHVQIFRWDASYSFFIEPLLFPKQWSDPTSSFNSTLAHEIFLWFRGQSTLDDRLIPQEEAIAGGLYSVRGYDQSIVAGDGLFNFTFEYRLHIPRLFRPEAKPLRVPVVGEFALVPKREYGFPDWDLILRGFFDTATTTVVSPESPSEHGVLLQSVGAGLELRLRQNVNVRFDWGVGIRGVNIGDEVVKAGKSKFHVSATFLF